MCSIENAVTHLPENNAEEARQECAIILRHARPPKRNIFKEEKTMLLNLKQNQQIEISKADKVNATVFMNTKYYNNKMLEHLTCGSYQKLSKEPGKKFHKIVQMLS